MFDPTQSSSLQLLQQVEMFVHNDVPIRVGLVFVVNNDDDVDGREDVGVGIMRAFNFATIDRGSVGALDLLVKVGYRTIKNQTFRS